MEKKPLLTHGIKKIIIPPPPTHLLRDKKMPDIKPCSSGKEKCILLSNFEKAEWRQEEEVLGAVCFRIFSNPQQLTLDPSCYPFQPPRTPVIPRLCGRGFHTLLSKGMGIPNVSKGLRHTTLWGRDAFHLSDLHTPVYVCKRCPSSRPWKPIGLWDTEDPTVSRQSVHRRVSCEVRT
jgi:hypothetical protein